MASARGPLAFPASGLAGLCPGAASERPKRRRKAKKAKGSATPAIPTDGGRCGRSGLGSLGAGRVRSRRARSRKCRAAAVAGSPIRGYRRPSRFDAVRLRAFPWHECRFALRREGHLPCYGNRAVWGSTMATETDFLRDPDGHGWHLDRALVDAWLLRTAVVRGTILLTPARQHCGDGWRARVATKRGEVELTARFAIDAGRRAAPLARLLGARRRRSDRLVCGWLHGPARGIGRGAGLTIVEAVEDGWWYTTRFREGGGF